MTVKLTLDGGLLRERVLLPAVRRLKTWEAEGRVELFESDRAKQSTTHQSGWPGAPSPARPQSRFRTARKSESGGVSFQQLSLVLFPQRDPQRLNMTEVNDVAHLLRHHGLGHTIFVTTNAENFMDNGKREMLRTAFKIMVLTPEEAVLALESSETSDSKKKASGA